MHINNNLYNQVTIGCNKPVNTSSYSIRCQIGNNVSGQLCSDCLTKIVNLSSDDDKNDKTLPQIDSIIDEAFVVLVDITKQLDEYVLPHVPTQKEIDSIKSLLELINSEVIEPCDTIHNFSLMHQFKEKYHTKVYNEYHVCLTMVAKWEEFLKCHNAGKKILEIESDLHKQGLDIDKMLSSIDKLIGLIGCPEEITSHLRQMAQEMKMTVCVFPVLPELENKIIDSIQRIKYSRNLEIEHDHTIEVSHSDWLGQPISFTGNDREYPSENDTRKPSNNIFDKWKLDALNKDAVTNKVDILHSVTPLEPICEKSENLVSAEEWSLLQ